jgi:hypothetical protein
MALSRTKRKPVEKQEPATTLCVEVATPKVVYKRTLCKEESCSFDEYSQGLCHRHYKKSLGFVLDEKLNLYVKKVGKKK